MIVIEIAKRMERGEPSLLFVNIRVYSWLSGHNHKIP